MTKTTPKRTGQGRTKARLACLAVVCMLAGGSRCADRREGVVELDVSGSLPDLAGSSLSTARHPSMRLLLHLLAEASHDEEVSGVLVRIGDLETGPARTAEVADALDRLADSGRTVHCHLESATNLSYWLAARGCERVALSPAGSLELTGLAVESVYVQTLLESLGLRLDVLRMGSHKGAFELLTDDEMSPETRETLEGMLDELTDILVTGIAQGRSLDPAEVRDLVDRGPFTAREALEAGLVDALEHRDEAFESLSSALPGEARRLEGWARRHGVGGGSVLQLVGGAAEPRPRGERVAILYLAGSIASEGTGAGLFGPVIVTSRVRRALDEIRQDDGIRALVVRIDSPGGSALASDEIWHEVLRVRATRPVVASMGDVAASGGYYIASAATEVLASPGSLTGSIGVVGGKLVAAELMERVGATPVTIRRGRNAGLSSMAEPWSAGQREALERQIRAAYDRFVEAIVLGRVMDETRVRALATGQVWTGRRAVELGLVDGVGGLHQAIVLARELAGLPEDAPVQAFPRSRGLLDQLGEGRDATAALLRYTLTGPGAGALAPTAPAALSVASLVRGEAILALWPLQVTVR